MKLITNTPPINYVLLDSANVKRIIVDDGIHAGVVAKIKDEGIPTFRVHWSSGYIGPEFKSLEELYNNHNAKFYEL